MVIVIGTYSFLLLMLLLNSILNRES